ncbi:MAG TPA: response regulator [Pyrinomonadaceae bacterium]|nr:response regulator [Pyrinomonadaceae bacterium]
MKILVAEDDVFSRTLLGATLKRLGHDALVVADGQEAIETYRRAHFPLVITDGVMPRVDGLELCNLIRAERRQNYTYIMLLTAMEGTQSLLEGLNAGADDFITKPFNEAVLEARIIVSERIVNIQNVNRAFARLIPICSYCKKARNDSDYWQRLDEFLLDQPDLQLSHGICPECYENTVRPELDRIRLERQAGAPVMSGQANCF